MQYTYSKKAGLGIFDSNPQGGCFVDGGMRMYYCGDYSIYQYSLSKAYDTDTLSYEGYVEVWQNSDTPMAVRFNLAGTKMYIASWDDQEISEYDLSTPWDITTAVYKHGFSVPYISGFDISSNGIKLYVCTYQWEFLEYTLVTPWDVSSAILTHTVSQALFYDNNRKPKDCWITTDGQFCFVLTSSTVGVTRMYLSTPYELDTGVIEEEIYDNNVVPGNDFNEDGIALNYKDESKLFLFGWDGDLSKAAVWTFEGAGRKVFWTNFIKQFER